MTAGSLPPPLSVTAAGDQAKLEQADEEKAACQDASDVHEEVLEAKAENETVPPFPWMNYFFLFVAFITNSIVVSFLWPIVGFMMMDYGLTDDRKEVGYYAGVLLSAFYAGRFFSSTLWGHVADRHGRKVVIYVAVVSNGLLTLLLGFVRSFEMAVAFRFLTGLLNGMLGVCKVVATELSHPAHEALGQTFPQVAWLAGLALGPSMAGLLAEPCRENSFLVGAFGEESTFCRRPFLLPCVVAALAHVVALPCVWCLPETGKRLAPADFASSCLFVL